MSGYQFQGRTYEETGELVRAMAENWEEGKKALFSGSLRAYAQQSARDLYYLALAAENTRKKAPQREDLIYFRWLYKSAGLKDFYWKGVCYGGPGEVIALLKSGNSPELGNAAALLAGSGLFSLYLSSAGAGEETAGRAALAEKLYARRGSRIRKESVPEILAGVLGGDEAFVFEGKPYRTAEELAAALQVFADNSPGLLEKKTACLYGEDGAMAPGFLAWLIRQGQDKALLSWHSRFQPAGEAEDFREEQAFAFEQEAAGEEFSANPQSGFIPTLKRPDPESFRDMA